MSGGSNLVAYLGPEEMERVHALLKTAPPTQEGKPLAGDRWLSLLVYERIKSQEPVPAYPRIRKISGRAPRLCGWATYPTREMVLRRMGQAQEWSQSAWLRRVVLEALDKAHIPEEHRVPREPPKPAVCATCGQKLPRRRRQKQEAKTA